MSTPIRLLAVMAALALLSLTALTFVDVIGRYFLSRPVIAASEIISLLLGLTIFTALPSVTQKGAHISVELLGSFLSPGQHRVRGVAVRLLTIFGLGLMSYVLYRQAARLDSMAMATPQLGLPFAPFVYIMAGAIFVSTALYSLESVRAVWKLATSGKSE